MWPWLIHCLPIYHVKNFKFKKKCETAIGLINCTSRLMYKVTLLKRDERCNSNNCIRFSAVRASSRPSTFVSVESSSIYEFVIQAFGIISEIQRREVENHPFQCSLKSRSRGSHRISLSNLLFIQKLRHSMASSCFSVKPAWSYNQPFCHNTLAKQTTR